MRLIVQMLSLVCAAQVFAHRPYEVVSGSLTRSDGLTVSAVEHYVDGIIGADPVSVPFRLRDGTTIGATKRSRDRVIVRVRPGRLEIYRFDSKWIPVANKSEVFDGYTLNDTTSTSQASRLISVLVHFQTNWREYAVSVVFAAMLVVGWLGARAIPTRGLLAVLRGIGFVLISLAAVVYAFLVLCVAPVSPLIVVVIGAVCSPVMKFAWKTGCQRLASSHDYS